MKKVLVEKIKLYLFTIILFVTQGCMSIDVEKKIFNDALSSVLGLILFVIVYLIARKDPSSRFVPWVMLVIIISLA